MSIDDSIQGNRNNDIAIARYFPICNILCTTPLLLAEYLISMVQWLNRQVNSYSHWTVDSAAGNPELYPIECCTQAGGGMHLIEAAGLVFAHSPALTKVSSEKARGFLLEAEVFVYQNHACITADRITNFFDREGRHTGGLK
ncbi:hypothetical protein K435DRAFT_796659 [Dendrothele bispora CBS 962.96]|uniref:Uncharacterized protein n=1 Tax=Dendrothele bispora (strain CBS 962.96) TaxID=1314807 RepID=A0A4S8M4W3_DENBC|nr:hypothetical protein K435DRAFT_796659 [Dendrothele bispora CBS 962.96]